MHVNYWSDFVLYIIFATLLFAAASGILSLQHQLQILQQNAYSLSAYFRCLKNSYTTQLALSAFFYCTITIGIIKNKIVISLVLALLLMILRVVFNINAHKKQTKRLAFTARVKRFYVTAILMLGVLVLVSTISPNAAVSEVFRMICLVLATVTPVLTFVVWVVTYPIERYLSAKRKKESVTDDGVAN